MKGCRLEVTSGAALLYPLLYFLDDSGALAAVLPAVIVHELGHFIAAAFCGIKIRAIRLEITGLCMETDRIEDTRRELFCLAAGPAAGFFWAGLVWIMNGTLLSRSVLAALIVNGFNLLPALPLDGGRILQLVSQSYKAACISTALCAVLFLFFAVRCRMWPCLLPVALFGRELLIA